MAEFLRIKGELFRLEGMAAEAEEQLRRSLDCARQQEALSWELRTSISLARLHQEQGRIIEARETVLPVYGRFKEGFQTADLTAAKGSHRRARELSSVERRLGSRKVVLGQLVRGGRTIA